MTPQETLWTIIGPSAGNGTPIASESDPEHRDGRRPPAYRNVVNRPTGATRFTLDREVAFYKL